VSDWLRGATPAWRVASSSGMTCAALVLSLMLTWLGVQFSAPGCVFRMESGESEGGEECAKEIVGREKPDG
jgi:hypothetical protein